jgi:hypothetical protein
LICPSRQKGRLGNERVHVEAHGDGERKCVEEVEEQLLGGEVAVVALSVFDESEDASELGIR